MQGANAKRFGPLIYQMHTTPPARRASRRPRAAAPPPPDAAQHGVTDQRVCRVLEAHYVQHVGRHHGVLPRRHVCQQRVRLAAGRRGAGARDEAHGRSRFGSQGLGRG